MKKVLILLMIQCFAVSFSQVKWMTFEEAVAAQAINPKKIIIDFYSNSCISCKKMDAETYNNPVIADYLNENYYPVQFNSQQKDDITLFGRTFKNTSKSIDSYNDLTKFLNVTTIPSTVFLDEQSMPITVLHGALTPKELEPYIAFISKDDYKNITKKSQWDTFLKKFKSKIKD